MTGNKDLGSSAPHAVFVFLGGMGPLVSPTPQAPFRWLLNTPPRWEVGPRSWPQMAYGWWGFDWPQLRPCHAPSVLGLAQGLDVRPPTARHGVSAPAPFRAGLGHRFRGSSHRAGWGAQVMSRGAPSDPATPVTFDTLLEFY